MSSWRGAFVPVETIPGELSEITEPDEPFAIASLVSLHDELRVLAPAMDVPFEPQACVALIGTYISDDDRVDDDPEIQTLTQLIIGADLGLTKRQPLWVVKLGAESGCLCVDPHVFRPCARRTQRSAAVGQID